MEIYVNKKETLLVYPYDIHFTPIIRHKNLLESFIIIDPVSPNGWGYSGKDAGIIDGGNKINLNIQTDFDKQLFSCDTVLFTESETKINFENELYPEIKKAISKGKNIIITHSLKNDIQKEIIEL